MANVIYRLVNFNLFLFVLFVAIPGQGLATAGDYPSRPEVRTFMEDLVKNHGFDKGELTSLFSRVQRQHHALDAIARPAESKPWYQYRPIFITTQRIHDGVQFWDENQALLEKAEETYGVSANIIVAILGVETFYGRRMGNYPVFDTLTTLGFDYPPRGSFFRKELKHFLLMAREEALNLSTITGSYAGAMGQGQFIPSSFREYAVDFDADGKRDLWYNNADAIGSVANYFKRHGWEPGLEVALPAQVSGTAYRNLLGKGLKPSISSDSLKAHGVEAENSEVDTSKVAFLEFELDEGTQYWIGFNNFYVITRYNRSPLYAMAVYQLSQEITKSRERAVAEMRSGSPPQ
jgi:membrane-bound lytic murein transglycosylase B